MRNVTLTHLHQMRGSRNPRGLLPLFSQLHRRPWPGLQKWFVCPLFISVVCYILLKKMCMMTRHFTLPDERDVYIAERLFSSSLVAVVSGASPRTLRIEHFKKVSKYSPLNTFWRLLPGNWNMSVFLRRPHSSSADEQSGEWQAWSYSRTWSW